MNAIRERDLFDKDIDVIVWATSQTWWRHVRYIDERDKNVLLTWSSKSLFSNMEEEIELPWLSLKDDNTIKTAFYWDKGTSEAYSGIRGQVWDYLTFWWKKDVTLHAMNMQWMSKKYPEQVIKALDNSNESIHSVLLISYEAWFDPLTNPKWSHVFYPVRETKMQMEESALRSCENAKIVDLLTFDSKSAKKLGLTFLWVVWDFINFLEDDYPSDISEYLKDFLGDSYQWVIDMFQELPIRWELWEWQKSMKELAWEWKLSAYINSYAKKNNFALYSRISWLITELYLSAAMKYMTDRRGEILSESDDRILLDWNKISSVDWFEELIDQCLKSLKAQESSYEERVEDRDTDDFFSKLKADWKEGISYTLNPKHIDTIWEHWWVIPLIISENLVRDSWILKEGERIRASKPEVYMFSWNDIKLVRRKWPRWDEVLFVNPFNAREVFAVFDVTTENKEVSRVDNGYVIPEVTRKVWSWTFPHSKKWSELHWASIQTSINWSKIFPQSSIKEHIWFRLAGLIFNNPDIAVIEELKRANPKLEKYDLNKNWIQWAFADISAVYENISLFEELPDNTVPELFINSISYTNVRGLEFIKVEIDACIDWKILWRYNMRVN